MQSPGVSWCAALVGEAADRQGAAAQHEHDKRAKQQAKTLQESTNMRSGKPVLRQHAEVNVGSLLLGIAQGSFLGSVLEVLRSAPLINPG